MTLDLLTHTLAILIGSAGGFLIASIFTRQLVRRAERDTWREAENLHRSRAIQDLRDSTSAKIS